MSSGHRPASRDLEELDPYEYKPLQGPQWLRILKLLPAPIDQDTVTCHLEHWVDTKNSGQTASDHGDPGGYEAMSWCWGVGHNNQSITIIENEKAYSFRVYEHLYEALKALRHLKEVRNLWVDAICINQDDLKERNQQVAKMNEVYGNATNVCIWLGKATLKTKTALNFIKNHLLRLDSFDELCRDSKYVHSWTAMLDLMKQQWFQRRWVVQEVSLARKATVYCGREFVTWEAFGAAVSLFVDVDTSAQKLSALVKREEEFGHADDFFKEVPALGATSLVKVTNRLFKQSVGGFLQRTSSLEDIVAHLAMFESSEPRDTIYALLALAKDSQPSVEGIPDHLNGKRLTEKQKKALTIIARLLPNPYRRSYVVNYNQEVVDVYQQFIAFAIAKTDATRALDIICRPFAPSYTRADNVKFNEAQLKKLTASEREDLVSLPSWIPNRSGVPFDKQMKPRKGNQREGEVVFSMERQRGDPFVSTPDSITYCAAGSKTYDKDKVRFRKRRDHYSMFVEGFILDTVTEVEPASQLGNIPAGWLAQGRKHNKNDPNIFWKTLVADRSPKGPAPLYYKNAIETALEHAPQNSTFDVRKRIQEATSEIVSGVLRQVQDTIWERCLVVTKRGFLGLAPRTTQRGDVVCILYGCSVPVVMRRMDKTEEQKAIELEDDERDRLARQEKLVIKLKQHFDKQRERHQESQRSTAHLSPPTEAPLPNGVQPLAPATNSTQPIAELPGTATPIAANGWLNGSSALDSPSSFLMEKSTRDHIIHIALAGLDLAFQRPLRRTTYLTAIACLISYGIQERLVAGLLTALAVPHLIADIHTSPDEYRFWQRDMRYLGRGFVMIAIMIICLSVIMASTWSCSAHAVVISVVFDAFFPELLPPSVGQSYRWSLVFVFESVKNIVDRCLRFFHPSRRPAAMARQNPPPILTSSHNPATPSTPPHTATLDAADGDIASSRPSTPPSQLPGTLIDSPLSVRRASPPRERKQTPPLDAPPLPCYYELVGESYIHSMMNGEAIELQNDSTLGGQDVQRIISEIFELR